MIPDGKHNKHNKHRKQRKQRKQRTRQCRGACAVLLLFAACTPEAPPAAPPQPEGVLVRTVLPRVEEVVDRAVLPADLSAFRRAVLAAEVRGTVESLPVEEAQAVAAGQRIAEIDTRSLEQAVAEAEALYRQAEAQSQRAERLFEKRSITQKALTDATTDREVAEVRLASARLDLAKSRITAPWPGQVAKRHVEVGDYVLPGQPVVELVDVSRLKVRAPAPASDIPYLRRGAPAEVRVDALPGEVFSGQVVRLAAELDPQARTLDVEVVIPNPEGRLKPGMLARVEIPRRVLPRALLIPPEAVLDLGGRQVIYVVEDGVTQRRVVELGPVTGQRVVVTSGLSEGERVVVEGVQSVGQGQAVREAPAQTSAGSAAEAAAPQGADGTDSADGTDGAVAADGKGR